MNRLIEARQRLRAAADGNDGKELAEAIVEYVDARDASRARTRPSARDGETAGSIEGHHRPTRTYEQNNHDTSGDDA